MKICKALFLLLLLVSFTQCDYLPFQKKKELVPLDTIVNFNSVDSPPSFNACKDLIEKNKKEECFRTTLSSLFSKEISKKENSKNLIVRSSIEEVVQLTVSINNQGVLSLKESKISVKILSEIPEIDTIFKKAIQNLPKVYPAIKRGIPVTTEYILPIRIKLEN